ncbi:MAG: hypothetical protein JOY99_16650 [Sphingomonadaceae bacterium]|nr:hypothetical protein [Sphingomonadaceae bacterium]
MTTGRAALSALAGIALGVASLATGLGALPALAQQEDRVLVIYGNDPCPNSAGQDIVVCARKPEAERYRIPSELRPGGVNNWREKAKDLEYVGAAGAQSCSASGTGGWTGCWNQLMSQARAERKEQKAADNANPYATSGTVH